MKKLLFSLFCVFLCISCSDDNAAIDEPTPNPGESQIEIPTTSLTPNFKSEGGESTIEFVAKSDWSVSVVNTRAENWCSVTPLNGKAGKANLTIRTTANETYDERNATVTLHAGTNSKNIIVTQKQKDALLVSSNKVEMKKEGGEFTIEVKANVTFSHSIDENIDWISVSTADTRGLTTTQLKFSVYANTSAHKREGVITVTDGTLSEHITVYQEGEVPQLTATANQQVFGPEGGTLKIEINSNIDYELLLPDASWIVEDQARNQSTHTLYFIISPNETYDNRHANIVFKDKESELADTVRVMQLAYQSIMCDTDTIFTSWEGGTYNVSLWSSNSVEIDSIPKWVYYKQLNTNTGENKKEFEFDITPNVYPQIRSGKIVISLRERKDIIHKILVVQNDKDSIKVSPTNTCSDAEGGTVTLKVFSNRQYECDVLSGKGWISVIEANKIHNRGNSEVILRISPNQEKDIRNGQIRLKCWGSNTHQIVDIVQLGTEVRSEFAIRKMLEKIYYETDGEHWISKSGWLSERPLNEWEGVEYNNGILNLWLYHGLRGYLSIKNCPVLHQLRIDDNEYLKGINIENNNALNYVEMGDSYQFSPYNNLEYIKFEDCPTLETIQIYRSNITDLNFINCLSQNLYIRNSKITNILSQDIRFSSEDIDYNLLDTTIGTWKIKNVIAEDSNALSWDMLYSNTDTSKINKLILEDINAPYREIIFEIPTESVIINRADIYWISRIQNANEIEYRNCMFYGPPSSRLIQPYKTCKKFTAIECNNIEKIFFSEGALQELSILDCTSLTEVACSYNQLISITLHNLDSLQAVYCNNNQLTELDISTLNNLKVIRCNDNMLTKFIWGDEKIHLEEFYCKNNHINAEFPEWFSLTYNSIYDIKYTNYQRIPGYNDDGSPKYSYKTNEYGWWYHGEPKKGYHGK